MMTNENFDPVLGSDDYQLSPAHAQALFLRAPRDNDNCCSIFRPFGSESRAYHAIWAACDDEEVMPVLLDNVRAVLGGSSGTSSAERPLKRSKTKRSFPSAVALDRAWNGKQWWHPVLGILTKTGATPGELARFLCAVRGVAGRLAAGLPADHEEDHEEAHEEDHEEVHEHEEDQECSFDGHFHADHDDHDDHEHPDQDSPDAGSQLEHMSHEPYHMAHEIKDLSHENKSAPEEWKRTELAHIAALLAADDAREAARAAAAAEAAANHTRVYKDDVDEAELAIVDPTEPEPAADTDSKLPLLERPLRTTTIRLSWLPPFDIDVFWMVADNTRVEEVKAETDCERTHAVPPEDEDDGREDAMVVALGSPGCAIHPTTCLRGVNSKDKLPCVLQGRGWHPSVVLDLPMPSVVLTRLFFCTTHKQAVHYFSHPSTMMVYFLALMSIAACLMSSLCVGCATQRSTPDPVDVCREHHGGPADDCRHTYIRCVGRHSDECPPGRGGTLPNGATNVDSWRS